jgi:hypothetical protein
MTRFALLFPRVEEMWTRAVVKAGAMDSAQCSAALGIIAFYCFFSFHFIGFLFYLFMRLTIVLRCAPIQGSPDDHYKARRPSSTTVRHSMVTGGETFVAIVDV